MKAGLTYMPAPWGPSRSSESHSQTCNPLVKHKQAQAAQASTREVGCSSAGWEIYDASV